MSAAGAIDADTLDTLHAASFARVDVSQTANFVLAAPNGSAGNPTFRTIVEADLPTLSWSKLSKSGSSLADLATRSAADLTSGTLDDARLSANVARLGTANVFTTNQTIQGTLSVGSGDGTVQAGGATNNLNLKAGGTAGNVNLIATGTAGASVNFYSHDTGTWQAYIWKGDLVLTGTGYQKGSIYWTDTSDRGLKTNIRPFTEGLSIVRQLRPVLYQSTGVDGKDPNRDYISVIADEVQAVLPRSVGSILFRHGDGTLYKTFNATEMFWSMLVAIQELDARLTLVNRKRTVQDYMATHKAP